MWADLVEGTFVGVFVEQLAVGACFLKGFVTQVNLSVLFIDDDDLLDIAIASHFLEALHGERLSGSTRQVDELKPEQYQGNDGIDPVAGNFATIVRLVVMFLLVVFHVWSKLAELAIRLLAIQFDSQLSHLAIRAKF